MTVLPVEIAQLITGYIADKKSLLNLLLISHTFRLLAERNLYADVSFDRQNGHSDAVLLAISRSFLGGITTGGGRCARYVKRLRLTGDGFLRRAQCTLFQTILKLLHNLTDLDIESGWWADSRPFSLRTMLEDPQSQSSPPPFTLRSFRWYILGNLDRDGLDWFLSHQTSLERLFLPFFPMSGSCPPIPTLPKLRVLQALDHRAAGRFLARNHVTHLKLGGDNIRDLDDAALRNVVVCALTQLEFSDIATAAVRMPNLECLEIGAYAASIPTTLSRLGMLKGATKLRSLRILPHEVVAGLSRFRESPWDYEDVVTAFNSLSSITHIIIQILHTAFVAEYFCFTRGQPQPTKLRSMRTKSKWWRDDWIEDCATVPFEPGDRRIGYKSDLVDAAGEVLPLSVESHIS